MIYSWTFITFIYKLPSWIYYLTAGEIATIFAYSMISDLLESLSVFSGTILVYTFLSQIFSKVSFIVNGTWLAFSYLGFLMIYLIPIIKISQRIKNPGTGIIAAMVCAFCLALFFSRFESTRKFAHFITERMTVFLIFFIPLSLVSLIVIVLRATVWSHESESIQSSRLFKSCKLFAWFYHLF